MKTKVCYRCKRELPVSEFYKQKRQKDGLHPYCKVCCVGVDRINRHKRKLRQERLARGEIIEPNSKFDVLGGYKCYILNYAQKGEFRFNVVSTTGDAFKTNNKSEFIDYITGL